MKQFQHYLFTTADKATSRNEFHFTTQFMFFRYMFFDLPIVLLVIVPIIPSAFGCSQPPLQNYFCPAVVLHPSGLYCHHHQRSPSSHILRSRHGLHLFVSSFSCSLRSRIQGGSWQTANYLVKAFVRK